jgi:hypothetical protein
LEPEMLAAIEPDIHLVSTLLSLKSLLPGKSRETARIVVRRVVGYTRRRNASRDVILCVDQSGLMAASVVYSGVFGAVLASIPSVCAREWLCSILPSWTSRKS